MEKKAYCTNCFKEVTYTTKKEIEKSTVRGEVVESEITHCFCDECHEEIEVPEVTDHNLLLAFDEYKIKKGLLTSGEIRALRDKYAISAASLAALIGAGEKTIVRYENGAIQDEIYDTILRLLSNRKIYSYLLEQFHDRIPEEAYERSKEKLIDQAFKDDKAIEKKLHFTAPNYSKTGWKRSPDYSLKAAIFSTRLCNC
jgi:putative zinc finger/helix-turn-helix YgiT family protein